MDIAQLLDGVDLILVSHLHQDHFDGLARKMLPKDRPLYCQPEDESRLQEMGFEALHVVDKSITVAGVRISRIGGEHGSGKWRQDLGPVSGFVLSSPEEPTLYWAGDTIWCPAVMGAIEEYRPNIIAVHASGAVLGDSGPIVMDADDVVSVCRARPAATVVAIHMEALDHATVNRTQLREHADRNGITEKQLKIPADGQRLEFKAR